MSKNFHRYPPNEEAFHKALLGIVGNCLTLTRRQRGYIMGAYRSLHPSPCPDEGCPHYNTGATCVPKPGGCIATCKCDPDGSKGLATPPPAAAIQPAGDCWHEGAPDGTENGFYAFHPDLIDADFNPHGVVEAISMDGGFIAAIWNNCQDCWDTRAIEVAMWREITGPSATPVCTPVQAPDAVQCGACFGSGWIVRDPDIGTDQECPSCDGSGVDEDAPAVQAAPVAEPAPEVRQAGEGSRA